MPFGDPVQPRLISRKIDELNKNHKLLPLYSLSFRTCLLTLSLSRCFSGHFPGEPGLVDTRMSPFWILLALRMTEVVMNAGAIRHQSSGQIVTTNTQLFTGRIPFLSPNQQCPSNCLLTAVVKVV